MYGVHPAHERICMKDVLLVSYYFPPSGGSGVQRPLKFTRYLPTFGWRPVVLTVRPETAAYPARDPALEAEVPSEAEVHRTSSWDPYRWYAHWKRLAPEQAVTIGFTSEKLPDWKERLARWVRANVFLPDARVGWVPFAYARARQLLRRYSLQVVLTTGPPHSTHLVGYLLKKYHGIPWVADFRDPWVGIDYYRELPMTPPARWLDAFLERRVLSLADEVLTVSPAMQAQLTQRVQRTYRLIYNGFDPADFQGEAPSLPDECFVIRHVGNLNADRLPEALFQAMLYLPEVPIRLELVGKVDARVQQRVRELGLTPKVHVRPYVSHPEAVSLMRSSHLLLLSINRTPGAKGIVTGKLFEYLASGRPILALAPPEGDAARILEHAQAGRAFEHTEVSGVARFLQEHLQAWQGGHPLSGASIADIQTYSRKAQTDKLVGILESLSQQP